MMARGARRRRAWLKRRAAPPAARAQAERKDTCPVCGSEMVFEEQNA